MNDDAGDGPSFVWEVGRDLIDLDHWARTYVALRIGEKESERSALVRYGYWPITALVAVVIGATSSVALAAALALFVAVVFVGARLWNRGAATRLAKQLHSLPAASEPFVFRADPGGTHGQSITAAEELSWSRYEAARLHDDLVVLTRDTGALLFLPAGGLGAGQQPAAAVRAISGWIDAADSTATSPGA